MKLLTVKGLCSIMVGTNKNKSHPLAGVKETKDTDSCFVGSAVD